MVVLHARNGASARVEERVPVTSDVAGIVRQASYLVPHNDRHRSHPRAGPGGSPLPSPTTDSPRSIRSVAPTSPLRIGIVTPYSWTYAGGVNRHVQALAEALIDRGHELRVLAPWDPSDRLSKALHRVPAEKQTLPDYLIPLGRTVGIGANGAVSNLSVFPDGVTKMRRELRAGRLAAGRAQTPREKLRETHGAPPGFGVLISGAGPPG